MTTPDLTYDPPAEDDGTSVDAQWEQLKRNLDGFAFRYGGGADAEAAAIGEPMTLRHFMHEGSALGYENHHWVIRDLLERRDKMIITGLSGRGKSTLMRQLALCAAGGVVPFDYGMTSTPAEPVRVALIDCENPPAKTWRAFAGMITKMRTQHGDLAASRAVDNLHIKVIEEGIDLLQGPRQEGLLRYLDRIEPDLVLVGSLYMLSSGDPNLEPVAAAVANCLRKITTEFDCALVVEAHSRKQPSRGPQVLDPQGANLWIKWPDIGRALVPEDDDPSVFTFARFRGDREPRLGMPERLRLDWGTPGMPWRAEHPRL